MMLPIPLNAQVYPRYYAPTSTVSQPAQVSIPSSSIHASVAPVSTPILWAQPSFPVAPPSFYPTPPLPSPLPPILPLPVIPTPLQTTAMLRAQPVAPSLGITPWSNDLKQLFHQNRAVIYALNLRTFGAKDTNGDGRISRYLNENGTFLSSAERLDELVKLGVNTIHLLPINALGKGKRLGEAGSLYAPSDYHKLNTEFDTPGNGLSVLEEARIFVNEAHKRGLRVMIDVPSCASHELAQARPELILKGPDGRPLVPTNWVDIVMFKNNAALQEYYEGFFDLMANKLGVDGFRVDVARARPLPFWSHFIGKYPDKAWLAESYCEEDQSPLKNLPRDIPEALLKTGFDAVYGQFHIFHSMANAQEYIDYLLAGRAMFQRASATGGNDKSFIGSFLTHDDPSLMEKGGVTMCLLASGLMATQPWSNPYILDGFTTGYEEHFDIFNFVPRHAGSHPEIGLFLQRMLELRKQYGNILSTGTFIPIPVKSGPNNQIIAFARQAAGKTLLVVANKDINARQSGVLEVPGLSATQKLSNLVPEYGRSSRINAADNRISVDLGPGRFHLFEIDTPNLARHLPAY